MTVGKRGLEESAAELGGEIEDLGWRDLDGLSELPEKARGLVLQSETGGYTVPYQQGQVLYIIEVTERREPERLTYQEVAERVREDYLIRFAQRLTREVVEARLTAAEFEFFEDRVLQMIGGP
jgi:parvulin-like peptidyl-prolyl isomerase